MSKNIYAEWSVASVFNKNGRLRYDIAAALDDDLVGNDSPVSISRTPSLPWPDEKKRVDSVADCIRELGYIVKCRTEKSPWNQYIISCIYKWQWEPDGAGGMRKQECYYGVAFCVHPCDLRSNRFLAGRRTIYEKADLYGVFPELLESEEGENKLRDISGEFTEQEIKTLIEDGSEVNGLIDCSNHKSSGAEYDPERRSGVSTIGNTLPADIVQALQDFRSDLPEFVREPDYEFYIPPSMQETPDACPPPEPANNLGGGAGQAAAAAQSAAAQAVPAQAVPTQAAAAAQASKKKYSTSDTSDSSESEDDC